MRFNLLKHNNLMLRSERRERLEAWAASDSPTAYSVPDQRYTGAGHSIIERVLVAASYTCTCSIWY